MLQRGGVSALKSTQKYSDTKRYRISQKSTTRRTIVPNVYTKTKSQKMRPKPVVFHQASSFQLSIASCLARAGLGLVLQSSLRTGSHPATWAPHSLPLVLLALFLLLAVLRSEHLSVSTGLRESSSTLCASGGSSSGPSTSAILHLHPKASILVSCAASPGLGSSCCFPCRGSCPCTPSGAFFLACGEVPPNRASLLSSRDGTLGAFVGSALLRLFYSPRVPSLTSCGACARSHCRVQLLGLLTETGLALHDLDARSHCRAQSPHLLAGALGIALVRYRPQPRPLPW